jgi:hypothetical protein
MTHVAWEGLCTFFRPMRKLPKEVENVRIVLVGSLVHFKVVSPSLKDSVAPKLWQLYLSFGGMH